MKITKFQPPLWAEIGKQGKRDKQLMKMNFGAKILIFLNFYVTFASTRPDLTLKHPGVLRLDVLEGQRYPIYTAQKLLILPKF